MATSKLHAVLRSLAEHKIAKIVAMADEDKMYMPKWGTGLFENLSDDYIIRNFHDQSGVTEKQSFLYVEDVAACRRQLDKGKLDKMLNKYLPLSAEDQLPFQKTPRPGIFPVNKSAAYQLCILGAITMQLGCQIRPDFRQFLQDNRTKVGLSRNAQVQLKHALNVYQDGTSYDFRYKICPTSLCEAHLSAHERCYFDLGGSTLKQPTSRMDFMQVCMVREMLSQRFKTTVAGEGLHPLNACGYCGKKKARDGSVCRPCSLCGQRVYCSRKCELRHRPKHKIICNDPFYRYAGNTWDKEPDDSMTNSLDIRFEEVVDDDGKNSD